MYTSAAKPQNNLRAEKTKGRKDGRRAVRPHEWWAGR